MDLELNALGTKVLCTLPALEKPILVCTPHGCQGRVLLKYLEIYGSFTLG